MAESEEVELKPFLVTMEQVQSASFVVMAEDRMAAQADAEELEPSRWETEDLDIQVAEIDEVPSGEEVWSGGPDGDWL